MFNLTDATDYLFPPRVPEGDLLAHHLEAAQITASDAAALAEEVAEWDECDADTDNPYGYGHNFCSLPRVRGTDYATLLAAAGLIDAEVDDCPF